MNLVCRLSLLLALAVLPRVHASGAARPPNVLVFYLDDMGWAQPGVYGGKLAPTPAIDAVARQGVRFTNGYVSACVCGPSRVGLMTGRYQARTGHDANGNRAGRELRLSETTMAQRLKSSGYATGIVGKWHLGDTDGRFLPIGRGFDASLGTVGNLGEGNGPRPGGRGDTCAELLKPHRTCHASMGPRPGGRGDATAIDRLLAAQTKRW